MTGRQFVVVIVAIGSIGTVGVAGAVAGVGPAAGVLQGERDAAALTSFVSDGTACTADFTTNSSTSITSDGRNTAITHSQNVSMPNPSYAVGDPTFERLNESTYVLSVPREQTEKPAVECLGVARYEATMRLPAGEDPWRVIVEHDNETAVTLFGDSNSTGASGSASAGAQVSG